MPNWVYSSISIQDELTRKQKTILKKIEERKSICDYYKPRPKALDKTSSPPKIVSKKEREKQMRENRKKDCTFKTYPLTKKMADDLMRKYGHADWYHWSLDGKNWGTKWGDCSLDWENENLLTFESAWSPISQSILDLFAKDFPNFIFTYEEEQGWGGEITYEDGEWENDFEYDCPAWEDTGEYWVSKKGKLIEKEQKGSTYMGYLTKLTEEHPQYEDDGIGYYADYSHDFLGKTLEDVKETIKSEQEVLNQAQQLIKTK